MEVVSAAADMLTERVGAGELVWCQDAHRFSCLMRFRCGGRTRFEQEGMILKRSES
jgi:hypothetical protein